MSSDYLEYMENNNIVFKGDTCIFASSSGRELINCKGGQTWVCGQISNENEAED